MNGRPVTYTINPALNLQHRHERVSFLIHMKFSLNRFGNEIFLTQQDSVTMKGSRSFRLVFFLTLTFSIPVAWSSDLPTSYSTELEEQPSFDWEKISPSIELKTWHPCYGSLECARFEVPVDWKNLTNPNKVILAVSRLPAKVDRSDALYGGPIIINPGGPGESGVNFLWWGGQEIQANLDGTKFFDIVSFDPRGVLNTSPQCACYDSSLARQVSNVKTNSFGGMDTSATAFNNRWAQARSFAQVCSGSQVGRFPDLSSIRQFASSALVAYDMLAIIDKLQEALEKPKVGPALLQYWGLSYGTLLGNTFASIFPSRIGRLILDGVIDAPNQVSSTFTTNLQDSMKTWGLFLRYCYEQKQSCPLFDDAVTSPSDIEAKVNDLLDGLKDDPLPAVDKETAEVVTFSDVRALIFSSLSFPAQRFPLLAGILSDLIKRNTSSIAPTLATVTPEAASSSVSQKNQSPSPAPSPLAPTGNSSWDRPMPTYSFFDEAAKMLACGDGDSLLNRTKAEELAYLNLLLAQSPLGGADGAASLLTCTAWTDDLRPSDRNRFTGPFGSSLRDYDSAARPILWIGNTADPITPLRNAVRMATLHEDSVVLTVDQGGHTSGPVNPSACVYDAVRKYVNEGILPEVGTVCKGDPWRAFAQ